MNLPCIVIRHSKYDKSVQNVMNHYIFSSESVNSLQIVYSLRILFLERRGPLGRQHVSFNLQRLQVNSCIFSVFLIVGLSLFLGRGCDEALFSEKKGFSVKSEEAIH